MPATVTEDSMTPSTATTSFGILAADKLNQQGLDFIESQPDAKLINKPGLSPDEYASLLAAGGIHAMIVRSGIKVTAEILENPGDLKIIARAGVGVDNIDLAAATAKGILVVNTAEASTLTTCEHALTLMMALARHIGPASRTMHEGGWDRSKFQGTQLAGKTLGVVGFGRIGRSLAERALAMEMNVVAFDPFVASETMLDGRVKVYRDFRQMLPELDVVSFHVPLNDDTRGMLGPRTWDLCKPNLLVINAARGGVVDEDSLIGAIDDGKIAGAAMDVYASEPPAEDSPLRTHPKILCTPHLGASTREAQQAVSVDAAGACLAYLRGEGIKGAVNAGGLRVDLDPMQRRCVDLAERMAMIISPMITRGISEITLELAGRDLSSAGTTIERAALVALLSSHMDVPLNIINIEDVAQQRGITTRLVKIDDDNAPASPRLTLTITGPSDAIDHDTHHADKSRRIVGRIYADHQPRIVEINGYHMDMIPESHMILIQNEDRPGMIGLVGNEMGQAGINIADMSISRRDVTALMVLKIDDLADPQGIERLRARPGILKVACVELPKADPS